MKTHFVKLRRLMEVAAVLAPILFFCAFMLFAAGFGWWSCIPAGLGMFLVCMLPFKILPGYSPPKPQTKIAGLVSLVVTFLIWQWIVTQPGFFEIIDSLVEERAMWDWRLILAVFVWLFRQGYSDYRKVADLQDREILEYYEDEPKVKVRYDEGSEF